MKTVADAITAVAHKIQTHMQPTIAARNHAQHQREGAPLQQERGPYNEIKLLGA